LTVAPKNQSKGDEQDEEMPHDDGKDAPIVKSLRQ
jgi:hypothetical protein